MHTHKHYKKFKDISTRIGEVVFGVEDGMVSTLGAISGIAIGTGDKFTVLLAGIVIVAVESVSMAIGSFISSSSSKEVDEKTVDDEKILQKKFPSREKKELYTLLVRDGWAKELAEKMADAASENSNVMLREHEYRQLGIFPYRQTNPLNNAFYMYFSYIAGGLFPLLAYFFLPVSTALYVSVVITLSGLFLLGVLTTRYTNVKPITAGLRFMILGGIAFVVGIFVGKGSAFFQ